MSHTQSRFLALGQREKERSTDERKDRQTDRERERETWISYMSDAVVYIDTMLSVAPAASLIRVGWKARQLTGPIL